MDELIADFLSALERGEAALLGWGLVDGFATEQELVDRADAFLTDREAWELFPDGLAMVDEMIQRRLLFRWNASGENRYRSRFAETLRLLARLRQLFPKHLRNPGAWLTAPTLVADFRLVLRSRAYPRRETPAANALAGWTKDPNGRRRLTALQEDVLRALLGMEGSKPGFALAGFQARATSRILAAPGGAGSSGTMVCAGTGSGKTLAFYLPAFTQLAGMIERDSESWTRALALYPRNELLKDQFTETCRMARKANGVMRGHKRRKLRIGTLYGSTPPNADWAAQAEDSGGWRASSGGLVCPFLLCPGPACSGEMIWRDADRGRGRERLVCARCDIVVEEDEIVLTRQRMRKEPPDILFTTTEMLNRRLSDSRQWHLFGVGSAKGKKPVLVLLDEAHTYTGMHGAQVAYLLRRWRHRSGCFPHFVGLSATLMEAAAFFAQLTGLPSHQVEEIGPETTEMIEEGMEYMVALRGDPVSGASLLSTTIQSAMLLRRALDPLGRNLSHGVSGTKVFVFTDNLDVTNRLYFNLLDAEGLGPRGNPDLARHPEGSLAALRDSTRPDRQRRFALGQSWELCEGLGHSLRGETFLRIGRVSSQDSGVDANAEIVVATASLEVGFNDPQVGVVIQHKAPHDAATFLQRKGRAGRLRETRPWTVVVLSDYGRDRLAYGGYDLLFDPELLPRDLPLRNRHVLKMQAVYASLDWLATQMPPSLHGQMWSDASGPWIDNDPGWQAQSRDRQRAAAAVLADVLDGGAALDRLGEYLTDALRLQDENELSLLLWEAPRALLTSAIPTLLRRLEHGWMAGNVSGAEYRVRNHPLPEFIPANLFSDLNLPEITIWARVRQHADPEPFPLPAAQALREFAPGRISRRFGIWHRVARHWIPADPESGSPQEIEIGSFCGLQERENLGIFRFDTEDGQAEEIAVVRPYSIHVRDDAPATFADSSNAFLDWRTQILPPGGQENGVVADLPAHSRWRAIIKEIRFFTHRQHQPARVRRFALGSRAEVRYSGGESVEVTTRFVIDDEGERVPAALGFAFEADAVRVRVRFPSEWDLAGDKLRSLRVEYLRFRIANDGELDGLANSFQRQWLAEVALAALTSTAISLGISLERAWETLRNGQSPISLNSVLEVIFQSISMDPDTDADGAARLEQKRHTEIAELLATGPAIEVLDRLVPFLWQSPDAAWHPWLKERFLATLGAALQMSIQQVCVDASADDLLVDLYGGAKEEEIDRLPEGCADLWITENSPGGGGLIERLLPRVAEEPRRFFDLLTGALGESDFETADGELTRLLGWIHEGLDHELAKLITQVRAAETQEGLTQAFTDLRSRLKDRGVQTSHPVVTALSARLLRPGSTTQTDALLHSMIVRWRQEEARLGVEIESRALAYALSHFDELEQALAGEVALGPGQDRQQWRFSTLYGLLWPRGALARNSSLGLFNPYVDALAPERLLVVEAIGGAEPEIIFESEEWRGRLERTLLEDGRAILSLSPAQIGAFRQAILALLVRPVDAGSLLLYPRIRGALRKGDRVQVTLELTAAGQMTSAVTDTDESTVSSRLIVKSMRGSRDEVRDLMESLLATELLSPGNEIWLVSPWITDIPVLDNRSGFYSGLEPSWPKRFLTLAELLAFIMKSSPRTRMRVVTRPDAHNRPFCRRLRTLTDLDLTNAQLQIDAERETLHIKGFVSSHFALKGSMNFTYNGIEVLEEAVELETERRRVAQLLLNFGTHYSATR